MSNVPPGNGRYFPGNIGSEDETTLGFQYMGINDHSNTAGATDDPSSSRMFTQMQQQSQLAARGKGGVSQDDHSIMPRNMGTSNDDMFLGGMRGSSMMMPPRSGSHAGGGLSSHLSMGDVLYNSQDFDGGMSLDSSMNDGCDEVAAAAFEAVLRAKNLDGSATGNECNLYIKNIDYDISDEVLYNVFSHIGEITSHHIVRDANNRSRGFGFM
jgi:hypothetical protein